MTQPVTDWALWRKCTICRAEIGKPCTSMSGRVVNGQPDEVRTLLEYPHRSRKVRTG